MILEVFSDLRNYITLILSVLIKLKETDLCLVVLCHRHILRDMTIIPKQETCCNYEAKLTHSTAAILIGESL